MYLAEAKILYPGDGLWHIIGEYNSYKEADLAARKFSYDCTIGDLRCLTNVVSVDALER